MKVFTILAFFCMIQKCDASQECSPSIPLKTLYSNSFNEAFITKNNYLTQQSVPSPFKEKCISMCLHNNTCAAAEWQRDDPKFCLHLYTDRPISVMAAVEPDDFSTVTFAPYSPLNSKNI